MCDYLVLHLGLDLGPMLKRRVVWEAAVGSSGRHVPQLRLIGHMLQRWVALESWEGRGFYRQRCGLIHQC